MTMIDKAQLDREADATAVLAELSHTRLPIEKIGALAEAVREGQGLDEWFIELNFVRLPRAANRDEATLEDLRPHYHVGRFPEQPQLQSVGARMLTLQEFVEKARERRSIFAQWGAAAKDASPGLREPII